MHSQVCTSRAVVWPMKPAPSTSAYPSEVKPSPLMCECVAIREDLAPDADGGSGAL